MSADPALPRPYRQKRSWVIPIGVVVVTVSLWASVFGIRWYREQAATKAWEDFKTKAEASGESFAWNPVPSFALMPEDQNFLAHPWVRNFIATHDNPPRSFIDSLESSRNLDDRESEDSGKSWLKEHPEAAAPTLAVGKAHEADLAALRDAAARSDISLGHLDPIEMKRLGEIPSPLALHAEAALATGDTGTAVADLEALLKIGRHLHKIPSMMAMIVASGFEGRAVEVIQIGLKTDAFSVEQRHQLALACRASAVGPDIVQAMRAERGRYLSTLNLKLLPVGSAVRPNTPFDSWGRFSSQAALTFCELLQPGLDPKADEAMWESITHQTRRLLNDKNADPARRFAAEFLNTLASAVPPMLVYDNDLQEARRQLAE